MGFRFRKSFKTGPFRLNLSKSGIGWSVGGPGYRFTKKAGGGTKYHRKETCSDMIDPVQMPRSDAESQGYTACKRCY